MMFWREVAAALLSVAISARLANAKLITITETASVCSAVYTSASRSYTIVQSTYTVVPIPWTDDDANSGTPFVLQVEPSSPSAGRRRAIVQPVWVKSNGDTTTVGSEAAQYKINNAKLTSVSGGHISTNEGVKFQPFALTSEIGSIATTFMVHQGVLNWTNVEFKQGIAQLYRIPSNGSANAPVIARFRGRIDPTWSPIVVYARPVRDATQPSPSVSTTVSTEILVGSRSTTSGASPTGTPKPDNASPNGLCGVANGYTCAGSGYGNCCSGDGFCGNGLNYCGADCQPDFGKCSAAPQSSLTVSSTSTVQATSSAVPTFACPADNGKNVVDIDGIEYTLGCAQDTTIGAYGSAPVANSFGECFALCDAEVRCTAFTYIGARNGIGAGVCYFKDLPATFVVGKPRRVAAIRITPFGATSSSSVSLYTSTAGPIGPDHPGTYPTSRVYSNQSMSQTASNMMPSGTLTVSPMGECGTQGNGGTPDGFTCTGSGFGACCSNSGFCGDGPDYCAVGCQSDYGVCTPQTGQPVTINGECGADFSNTTCTGGKFGPCCSNSGFCGSTLDYCGPQSCNPAFGTCGMSNSSMTASMTPTMGSATSTIRSAGSSATSNPTSTPLSNPSSSTASSTTVSTSSSSTIPVCPQRTCGPNSKGSSSCSDSYGNTFNITCGTSYQGNLILRAAKANVGACLTLCDTTAGCIAVSYFGGTCDLLSTVTGELPVAGGAGATRPTDVATVYTAPPMSTTSIPSDTAVSTSDMMTTSNSASEASFAPSTSSGTSSMMGESSAPAGFSSTSTYSTSGAPSSSLAQSAGSSTSSSVLLTATTSTTTRSLTTSSMSTTTFSAAASSSSLSSDQAQTTSSSSTSGSTSTRTRTRSSTSLSSGTHSDSSTSSSQAASNPSSTLSSTDLSAFSSSTSTRTGTRTGSYTGSRTRSRTTTTTTTASSTSSSSQVSSSTSTTTAGQPTFTPTTYDPPCPAANGTGFTDTAGNEYVILCDKDTAPGAVGVTQQPNFAACINSCSSAELIRSCVSVTYVGGTCYYKSEYQGNTPSIGAYAAVLASLVGVTPATYSPVSSTAYSTTRTTTTRTTTTTTSSSRSSGSNTVTAGLTTTDSSATSSESSSSTSYLILTSPTPCDFGDPPNTDEDDSYCEIDLPFAMRMYAQSDARTYASTNGFLSIKSGSAQYQPGTFPLSYLPNNTVAPFMDDLYLYGTGSPQDGIFYQIKAGGSGVTYEYYLERAGDVSYPFHFTVDYDRANPGIFVFTYYSTGGPNDNGIYCGVGTQGIDDSGNFAGTTYGYESGSIQPGLVVTCDTNQNTCVTTTPPTPYS